MFLYFSCGFSKSRSSPKTLEETVENDGKRNEPLDFERPDFDLDGERLDFDPSLDDVDASFGDIGLGDFGLDDESAEPEVGDFWIEPQNRSD